MLQSMRHKPRSVHKSKRLPWRRKMTLCIAAVCREEIGRAPRIVISADKRSEVAWAGGNVAFKFSWGSVELAALIAGDESKARDLLITCCEILGAESLTMFNIEQKINQAAAAHKAKLVDRHVRSRAAISFERFLTNGQSELTAEVRN